MPAAVGVMADSYTRSPVVMAGLTGWWDADSPSTFSYTSGVIISQWRSKAGTANNFVVPGASIAPTRSGSQNGRTTVVFADAPVCKLTAIAPISTDAITIIVAGKASTATVAADRMVGITTSDQVDHVAAGHAAAIYFNTLTSIGSMRASAVKGVAPFAVNTPFVAASIYDGANHTMYKDGVAGTTVAATGTFIGPVLRISYQGTNAAFKGELYELMIYNRALLPAERQQDEAYLKARWGTP